MKTKTLGTITRSCVNCGIENLEVTGKSSDKPVFTVISQNFQLPEDLCEACEKIYLGQPLQNQQIYLKHIFEAQYRFGE